MILNTLSKIELEEARRAMEVFGQGDSLSFTQEILSNPKKYPNLSIMKEFTLDILHEEMRKKNAKSINPDFIGKPHGFKPEHKEETDWPDETEELGRVFANKEIKIKLRKSQWEMIGRKNGWLRKSQNAQNIREFYHGTSSGTNNQNIISFKKGINPSMAKGYGQGEGFYVWLNKNNAVNHSKEFSSGGYSMIVTVQTELSPQNFDLDHEVMSSVTGQFIADTWDVLFKKLPEGSIQTERGIINILKSRIIPNGPSAGAMQFFFTNGKIATKSPKTESDVGTGELFGAIFNILQKQFPQQTSDFEFKAFSQVVNNANTGLKYVGSQTLIPSKIECLVNNQWVDAIDQNIPLQVQPQPQLQQQQQQQQPQATSLTPITQPTQY